VRIGAANREGRGGAEYLRRSPFSLAKVRYHGRPGTIIDRAKRPPGLTRHVAGFAAGEGPAARPAPLPNAGEPLGRADGWDSNASRGNRRNAQTEDRVSVSASGPMAACRDVAPGAAQRAWARRITPGSDVEPLRGPRCGSALRIIAVRLSAR
jgi:hypothetical protein